MARTRRHTTERSLTDSETAAKHIDRSFIELFTRQADAVNAIRKEIPKLPSLTAQQRKRALKFGSGNERHLVRLARLALDNPALRPEGVDPAEMLAELSRIDGIDVLLTELATLTSKLQSARLALLDENTRDALDIYAIAQASARRSTELADKLAPITEFFANAPSAAKIAADDAADEESDDTK